MLYVTPDDGEVMLMLPVVCPQVGEVTVAAGEDGTVKAALITDAGEVANEEQVPLLTVKV